MQSTGHLSGATYVCDCYGWGREKFRTNVKASTASRLIIGAGIGIPAASLCINRRLYKIATCRTATITHAQVSISAQTFVGAKDSMVFCSFVLLETPCRIR